MTTPENASASPDPWVDFKGGSNSYNADQRKKAIDKCRKDGVVRGEYSNIELSSKTDRYSNLYPTFDHVDCDGNDDKMVVETALINRLKTNLPASDFWRVIRHLYWVGVDKGKFDHAASDRFLQPEQWKAIDDSLKNNPSKTKSFIAQLRDEIKSRSGNANASIPDTRIQKIIEKLFLEQPVFCAYLIDSLVSEGEQLVKDLITRIEEKQADIEIKAKESGIESCAVVRSRSFQK